MKGFSLLEIMVTVAIIGIMASSVVIGFNSFGETVRVRETAGVLTDTLKRLELETIRRDFQSSTVYFEDDYLVVVSDPGETDLNLSWSGINGCSDGNGELTIDNAAGIEPVYLAQRDAYGNNLEILAYEANTTEDLCVEFFESDDIELQYQLFQGPRVSPVYRFIHFNVRRGEGAGSTVAITANDYSMKIEAPYAKTTFYSSGVPEDGTVTITLSNEDGEEEITLQE